MQTTVSYILITLLGAIVGSFLNVIIYRLPIMLNKSWHQEAVELLKQTSPPNKTFNLALPHSHCPHCEHKLAIWHNIPILSYVFLRGKCSFCHHSIHPHYFLVELLSAALSLFLALHFGMSWELLASLIFAWIIIPIAFIDLAHFIIPDSLNYSLLWIGLLVSTLHVFPFSNPRSAIIGAITGYLFLFIVAYLFKLLTKKTGMGHGDFKLLAALGAWTGWEMLIFIVLCSSILGLIAGLSNIIFKRKNSSNHIIPFGPFLVIAGFIALIFYVQILNFYLR